MKKTLVFLIASVAVVFSASSADARLWKNTQGKTVNGHYLTSDSKNVVLVLAKDGREVMVAKDQFSEEDQKYIEEQEVLLTVPAYEEMEKEKHDPAKNKNNSSGASGGAWQRGI